MSGSNLSTGMPELLERLWHHLTASRRRQFVLLTGLMLVSAIAELVSLSAIFPFLGILIAPQRIFSNPAAAHLARTLNISSSGDLVLPLTIAFGTVAVLAGVIRTLLLRASTRLAFATGADLSSEVYRRTLHQPYAVHVHRNSSEVISGITGKIHDVVFGVLVPLLTLISSIVLLMTITAALIAFNPVVALVAIGSFGACYVAVSWLTRRRLRANSERIAHEQTQVIKALQEGLGGIRDVLLHGSQHVYCEAYHRADSRLRRAQGSNVFVSQSPRFATEALGMVMIAALAYVLSRQPGGIASAFPLLGALAVGAQRLLPALQQAHAGWASITGHHASLADAIGLLDQPMPHEVPQPQVATLPFHESIRFDGVRFRYSSDGPWVLDGVNLTIRRGMRIGLVGTTGSGKSTLLDLLMGLLEPTEGTLLVDGRPLTGSRVGDWQRTIAHVPQNIFLADATLAQNIALGVPTEHIDVERVRLAARQAQIADFIEGRPEGYDVLAGERGVRLSGGQRQRIGIARALYRQASVLVFDEATSALDNATERSVMDAIGALRSDLTIVLIAHRLSTVRHCDSIVELDCGRVVSQGSYGQLLERSSSFRRMANASEVI